MKYSARTAAACVALALFATPAMAMKDCETLKSEIDAKLQAKGVQGYSLTIVDQASEVGDARVVGTCDGGKRKITYKRG
jgi:hypothetical protein